MHISAINIYPIKSLKGIDVDEAAVEDRGLRFDRRWMLVDESNRFMTQREFPKMATIRTILNGVSLSVSANGAGELAIPQDPAANSTSTVEIWSSRVRANGFAGEIDQWFSGVLGTACRLVRMPEETKRKVNPWYAVRKYVDTVSFADGYPFLLIGDASLEDLNSRLEQPLPMNRFRPNFVAAGRGAFAEDGWRRVRIGETVFHVVKPCDRCVIPSVDQDTGEKTGKEPLKTLATFRTRNNKVLFGQNLIAEKAGGTVRVGDDIEVLEAK